jgi:hypothetical protein
MARFVLACCTIGSVLLCGTVDAQCGSGSGGQGTSVMPGQVLASYGMGLSPFASGGQMFANRASPRYDSDLLVSQMMAQQFAQQQYQLAMQYQQAREEKLSARRARAEQTRAKTAESRQRTRVSLAVQNSASPAKSQPPAPSLQQTGRR